MVPAVTNTGKDPKGKGQSSGDGTFMENSAMVPSSTTAVNRHFPSDSSSTEHSSTQQEFIMLAGVLQLVVWPLSGVR